MKIEELSIRIAEHNDQAAFRELFNHFYPGLLSFAQSFLKDRPLAEEVTEDVLIRLWENRSILPTIKSLSYYLYVATRHACINASKKKKRHETLSFEEIGEAFAFGFSNTERTLIQDENLSEIAVAINSLPPKCRLVFRLIKEEGLKYREVAQLTGLSEKTVEAHMRLAMRKIVDQLQARLPEYRSYFLKKKRSL